MGGCPSILFTSLCTGGRALVVPATASERTFEHLEEELLQGLAEIHQRVDSLQSFFLALDGAVQKLALSGALLRQRLRILEDIVEARAMVGAVAT